MKKVGDNGGSEIIYVTDIHTAIYAATVFVINVFKYVMLRDMVFCVFSAKYSTMLANTTRKTVHISDPEVVVTKSKSMLQARIS